MKQTRSNLRIVGGTLRQASGSKNLGANVTERAPQRKALGQTHALLVTDRWVGARATNVLVTDRERGWKAPSGKRANGKPNTYLRTALKAGQDRSGYVTADNVTRAPQGKYVGVKIDGPDAGLTSDGRGRRYR